MANLDALLGTVSGLPLQNKAVTAGLRIKEDPVSVTVRRVVSGTETTLAAQEVRIEPMSYSSGEIEWANGTQSLATLVILGYKGCPGKTDTDLRRNDRFYYGGEMYDVIEVIPTFTDRLVATARVSE